MKTDEFDYYLPEELIAQTPLQERSASRLMALDKQTGDVEHRYFFDIQEYLHPGDCLVLNDSRVLPARLFGKLSGGGKAEILLLAPRENNTWEAIVKPGKKLRENSELIFSDTFRGTIKSVLPDGNRLIEFSAATTVMEEIYKNGVVPLPPYIKESLSDSERYQTVYSKVTGSAAAPTAGLHFTKDLLKKISEMGVSLCYVTLHIGLGTFRPVKVENIEEHVMHKEFYSVSQNSADMINSAKKNGGKIICVGTTSCRTIESACDANGNVLPGESSTTAFFYPGYKFKVLDSLITNFHLPKSTLLMLVSALGGYENVMNAYREAVEHRYRFFSFGDAMFIH